MTETGSVAFVGGGNMARSLIAGLIAAGRPAATIVVADPDAAQRERLTQFAGIRVTADNDEAVAGAALVVLAVKPQVAPAALATIADRLRREHPTLLSIAAGLRIRTIIAATGVARLSVVRAMPNTPALVGRGASAWYANAATGEDGRCLAHEVLQAVGIAIELTHEEQLDAVTGLSGSGPAYFFLLVEALAEAGAALGLTADEAARLAAATGIGAMALLDKSGEKPAALREHVTSPGGTTAAALAAFEEGDFRGLVTRAVERATARARQLGS